jgi:CheY-like chemotaxis protein
VKNAKDAINIVQKRRFDLILMDHMMPETDGIEATAIIRNLDGDYPREIPIIALTANTVYGMREVFMKSGFNDFLSKPIDLRRLNEILEKWLPEEKKIRFGERIVKGRAKHIEEFDNDFSSEVVQYREPLSLNPSFLQESIETISKNMHVFDRVPTPDENGDYFAVLQAVQEALAKIGANEIRQNVERMEDLASIGATREMEKLTPSIKNDLRNLLVKLNRSAGGPAGSISLGKRKILDETQLSMLRDLKRSILKNEFVEIDRLISAKNNNVSSHGLESEISRIMYHVNMYNYQQAIDIIDNLLE